MERPTFRVYDIWEISAVCLEVRRDGQLEADLELNPLEARDLAAKLLAAAASIEQQDADLDTFFWHQQNPWVSARHWGTGDADPF